MVVDGEAWHRGVIGITATRVVERYGRPVLIISREGEEAHGSGRSIPAFHLLSALESCPELFSRYGGHAHAVGFALPVGNVQKLREHLDAYARARLTPSDFEPQLECARELPLDEVTPELHRALSLLEPFGMENPEPVFTARAVRVAALPQAVKDKHVRLRIAPAAKSAVLAAVRAEACVGTELDRVSAGAFDSAQAGLPPAATQSPNSTQSGSAQSAKATQSWRSNISFKAMGWGLKEACDKLQLLAGDRLDIAYTLGMNDHPEFGGLELTLRDLRRGA